MGRGIMGKESLEGNQAPRKLTEGSQQAAKQPRIQEVSERGWGHFVLVFTAFFARGLFILTVTGGF